MGNSQTDPQTKPELDKGPADPPTAAFNGPATAADVAARMSPDALPPAAALAIQAMDHAPLMAAMSGAPQEAAAGIIGAAAAVVAQTAASRAQSYADDTMAKVRAAMDDMEDRLKSRIDAAIRDVTGMAVDLSGNPIIAAIIGVLAKHHPTDISTIRAAVPQPSAPRQSQ